MRKLWKYILAGIIVALGGIFVSDLGAQFFSGLDYGSGCILGICIYLCVVIVICTGIIVTKLDENTHSEETSDKNSDL